MDYYKYLASREWAILKNKIKARCHGVCERCACLAEKIEVHHLTYERLGHERLEDLMGLCRPCHKFLSAKSDFDPGVATQEKLVQTFIETFRADASEIDAKFTASDDTGPSIFRVWRGGKCVKEVRSSGNVRPQ